MADPTSLAGLQLRTDRELAASAERLARHFKIDPPDYGPKRMDVRKQNIGRAEGVRDFLDRLIEHVGAAEVKAPEPAPEQLPVADQASTDEQPDEPDPNVPGTGKPLSYFDGKSDDDILDDEDVPVGEKRLETIHKMREARE